MGWLTCYSQDTGPGGVGTAANTAFWLDAGSLGLGDGAAVSSWADQGGNGNDFSQSVGGSQPTYHLSGSINGLPTVDFGGAHFLESGAIPELDSDEISFFIVSKSNINMTNGSVRCLINNETDLTNQAWKSFYYRASSVDSYMVRHGKDASLGNVISSSKFPTSEIQTPKILSQFWTASNNINGKIDGSTNAGQSGADLSGWTHTKTTIGSQFGSIRFFNGEIAEVIVFDEVVNAAQEIIIYNYLGAKYNISLDANAHYTAGATHGAEVAGIGREDASNIHNSAQGSGIVAVTSAGITSDGAYLLWGHDEGGLTTTAVNTPAAYAATGGTRLVQEWKVSEVSEVGDITLEFDLTGITFGKDDQYELLVDEDGDGDFSDAITYSGIPTGDIISFSLTANDLDDGYLFTIGNTQEKIISVIDGQNWNDVTTWSSDFLPTTLNDVIVDNGHAVTVSDNQFSLDLTVNGTGTLVVDNGANLEVSGNVDSDGTFTCNSGSKITLNGAVAQTLDFVGTIALDSLEVNNANGVTFNTGSFTFSGTLFPTSGDVDFGANSVTFLSDATGTASIGPIGGGVAITMTNVTSQRFIEGGDAGWTEVGFPFDNSFKLSDWDDELFISGPGGTFLDGCAYGSGGSCFTSVKYWDPSLSKMFGVTNADSAVNAGRGFDIYLGDNLSTFSAATISTTKNLNLNANPAIAVQNGWNFIANPVLAPIDWNNVTLGGGVNNYFWVFDAEDGWQFYEPGGSPETFSANLTGGIISAYQGIWVFNSGGASDVTFNESAKSVGSSDAFVKSLNGKASIEHNCFTMRMEDKLSPTTFGKLYIDFANERSNMPKLPTLPGSYKSINLYADFEGEQYSVLTLGTYIEDCIRLPIGMEGVSAGVFSLSFDNVPKDRELYIVNYVSGERIRVTSKSDIEIYLTEQNRSAFKLLVLSKSGDCETSAHEDLNVAYNDWDGIVVTDFSNTEMEVHTFNVFDLTGKLILSEKSAVDTASKYVIPANLSAGSYIIEVRSASGIVGTGKVVVTQN
ncbi:T9SS type A sorting domain-containing protein [Parvicella tangerina]|nr:T9SS type A sorting domain-containing protein [Parvicella tangerina]